MDKYKDYSYDQGVFLPVFFDKQILPGTFKDCLNYLVDNKIDLTVFGERYKNDDRIGSMGKPVKSNITDNESAKMNTKGMAQGYNGVAVVDDKHQVIVGAEAFGKGPEQDLLKPMIDTTKENLENEIFEDTKVTVDSTPKKTWICMQKKALMRM